MQSITVLKIYGKEVASRIQPIMQLTGPFSGLIAFLIDKYILVIFGFRTTICFFMISNFLAFIS